VPDAGVPLRVPVPLPLSTNVTPLGIAPDSVRLGVGTPVACTVNDPAVPTVKLVLAALVKTGARFTVNVKLCVAGEPMPLLAVKRSG